MHEKILLPKELASDMNEINNELATIETLAQITDGLSLGICPELTEKDICELIKIQKERTEALREKMGRVIEKLGV